MKVAILGPGRIGGALAQHLGSAGHELMLSVYRDRGKAEQLVRRLGSRARLGEINEAALWADVFALSVPFRLARHTVEKLASISGRVLIDCTNRFDGQNAPQPSVVELAALVPGLAVVKAFNTLPVGVLTDRAYEDPKLAMAYCGSSPAANAIAAALIRDCGFDPLYLGPLANAGLQSPGGPFFANIVDLEGGQRMASSIASALGMPPAINPLEGP